MNNIIKSVMLIFVLSMPAMQAVYAQEDKVVDDYMPSLSTKTPLDWRLLAIKIVRKAIGAIQQDAQIKQAVREKYQDDPQLLIYSAELVALEFKTIAIANNYWR